MIEFQIRWPQTIISVVSASVFRFNCHFMQNSNVFKYAKLVFELTLDRETNKASLIQFLSKQVKQGKIYAELKSFCDLMFFILWEEDSNNKVNLQK